MTLMITDDQCGPARIWTEDHQLTSSCSKLSCHIRPKHLVGALTRLSYRPVWKNVSWLVLKVLVAAVDGKVPKWAAAQGSVRIILVYNEGNIKHTSWMSAIKTTCKLFYQPPHLTWNHAALHCGDAREALGENRYKSVWAAKTDELVALRQLTLAGFSLE